MKKTILILLLSIFVISCNNKKVEKVESDSVTCQLLVVTKQVKI
jgi:hypothetical protein